MDLLRSLHHAQPEGSERAYLINGFYVKPLNGHLGGSSAALLIVYLATITGGLGAQLFNLLSGFTGPIP